MSVSMPRIMLRWRRRHAISRLATMPVAEWFDNFMQNARRRYQPSEAVGLRHGKLMMRWLADAISIIAAAHDIMPPAPTRLTPSYSSISAHKRSVQHVQKCMLQATSYPE